MSRMAIVSREVEGVWFFAIIKNLFFEFSPLLHDGVHWYRLPVL